MALSKDRSNPRWKPLCPCSKFNAKARAKKKIMAKTNWFKRGRQEDDVLHPEGTPPKKQKSNRIAKDDAMPSFHQGDTEEELLISIQEEGSDEEFQVFSHLEGELLGPTIRKARKRSKYPAKEEKGQTNRKSQG